MNEKLGAYLRATYGCKAFFDGENYIVHPDTPLPEGAKVTEEDLAAFTAAEAERQAAEGAAREEKLAARQALREQVDSANTVPALRRVLADVLARLEAVEG